MGALACPDAQLVDLRAHRVKRALFVILLALAGIALLPHAAGAQASGEHIRSTPST